MPKDRTSMLEQRQSRATFRDAIPAVVTLVALEGIVAALDLDAGSNSWHLVISLSPLLAAVWLVRVQLRTLRRCDEYQRTLHLEAMSVGFGFAMLVAMAGGLLSGADVGSEAQFLQLTFIVGILSWVGALAIRMWR
jgi:hydrogenase-4 membrane subunit HyfE